MLKKLIANSSIILLLSFLALIAGARETPGVSDNGWASPDTLTGLTREPLNLSRVAPATGLPPGVPARQHPIPTLEPSNLNYSTTYDPTTGLVTIYRKIGNIPVRLPYTMTLEEYANIEMRRSMMQYWENHNVVNEAGDGPGLRNIRVGSEAFETIFGSNIISIRPQGMAELRLGVNHTRIDNPTLQEKMRTTTSFDFQQKIQMNIRGEIGERLRLGINYNTEATFDFENQISIEYEGGEDDIIQTIEAGNVTLPLPGTLITGSQSLFGVKTGMRFGNLTVTSVFSQQRGQTSVMNIQGGAQAQEFDIAGDQYDRNRHFFLSHFFRDNFNQAMSSLPLIKSPFNITRVEVWVTNRTNNFEQARNVIAFTDLGEHPGNMSNPGLWGGTPNAIPSNATNNLYREMTSTYGQIRDFNQITALLAPLAQSGFSITRDFERIENARLLPPTEFTLNSRLGFISLNTPLHADEILAVAFEYTYNGEVFRVGEFSNSGIQAPNTLIMKLIKGTLLSPAVKTWDLMMKNIYSIGAHQVNPAEFQLNIVMRNDSIGRYINFFPEGPTPQQGGIKGELLLSAMELDNLDNQLEPFPDGRFDFIPGYTIIPAQGRIIFPVLEPFGSHLESLLAASPELRDRYVFHELYDSTFTVARQMAGKNRYRLTGSFRSAAGAEISLNAFNIPRGSVVVTAGGLRLNENIDYTVDYTTGRIRILNQGLLESGTPIQVSLENHSLFNLQTRTLVGTHLDYRFNENFNIGATVMHLRERPLTQKVNLGDEPIANTIWGLNTAFFTESNLITSLIDRLPLIQTRAPSSLSFEAEFAHLVPGHPDVIQNQGTSYIDDFERTKIQVDLKQWTAWNHASTPQGQNHKFPEASLIGNPVQGNNRARLAWYVIDPLFLRNNVLTPTHIRRDPESQSNHYVREVFEKEIFPLRAPRFGEPTNIPVLNLAFYPRERGPYNFDTNIDFNGYLNNPASRWGGITRRIDTNDFEAANIDHIEFWLMDPFIYDQGTHAGGDLFINLGNISEDILRDSRKFFEQGLPGPGEPFDVDSTAWGYVPRKQSLVNAFSNDPATRLMQDVGLDGISSEREQVFHRRGNSSFLNAIETLRAAGAISTEAYNRAINDPASDDFQYFRGSQHDRVQAGILDRYKHFNNPEGNSRPSEYSGEPFSTAATNIPDSEDINRDNTLSETESYFQYRVSLRPEHMVVGQNNITSVVTTTVRLKNGRDETINWYQFKIPISNPDTTVGDLHDLRSIRFMRMFLHGFNDSIFLRFASLDLVRSEWRRYERDLFQVTENVVPNPATTFDVSAVNIEENGTREPVNYILPPGVTRVIDPANPSPRELNEQSISLRVTDLARGDARAVYKNMNLDLRQHGRLKMEVHAQALRGHDLQDGEMTAFIRLGTDYHDNYYEYEVPLTLTPFGSYSNNSTEHRYMVWPESNRIDVPLDLFQQVKLRRNDAMRAVNSPVQLTGEYQWFDPDRPDNRVKIKGNPNLANVRTMMIGVRNRSIDNKSVEVWMNELRLTDFNERGGWAANSRMNIRLADLGSVSLAGKASTIGFGSIDQGVTERSKENFHQFDVATSLELGKLLGPESRVSIPFFKSMSESIATPEYYPLDPDIKLDVVLDNAGSREEKDSIRNVSQDYTRRRSISFTNVRIEPNDNESRFYDISNISMSYSFNETFRRNIDMKYLRDVNYRGLIGYNFMNQPTLFEPFRNLQGNALALIRDFNLYLAPSQVSYRMEMIRGYREEQLRNIHNPGFHIPLTVNKNFFWNRHFDLTYNLTRSLQIDFRSVSTAVIDEPQGPVNKRYLRDEYEIWRDSVLTNIFNNGRPINYQHTINVRYNIPVNKLPFLNWTSASLNYSALYNWQQGPRTGGESNWGNIIRNSNNIQGNAQLNFNSLYNRSTLLRQLNQPAARQQPQGETVRFTQHNIQLQTGSDFNINHQLGTPNVTVRVFNEAGHPVSGEQRVVDANNVVFVPRQDVGAARVMVTGQKEVELPRGTYVRDFTLRLLTSLRNISVNYSMNSGTILPGYLPGSSFMGSSEVRGTNAPGLPFMLGWQDRNFAMQAVERGWITPDTTLYSPFSMTNNEDLTIRGLVEPVRGLRIDLTANHRSSNSLTEYYLFGGDGFRGVFNTMETGNFSMTFNILRSSFSRVDKRGVFRSEPFERFLANREIIANRLAQNRVGQVHPSTGFYQGNPLAGIPYNPEGYPELGILAGDGADGYGLSSQNVMIPALLAAYSGIDPGRIFLDPIPPVSRMQPNWRVTFDGLSNIPWLQQHIRSISLSHAYRSTYTVGSFITNLDWEDFRDGFNFVRDARGDFIPKFQISGVSIAEQYSPLIQLNVTWQNNLSTRAEYKRGRIINLSLNNNQLIENHTSEWVIGLGYRFDNLDMILGTRGEQRRVTSDLNVMANISIRDNFSIIRRIEEGLNQLTSGQRIVTMKLTGDYVLSDRFNMQLFYDRTMNAPYISTTFPITTSSFGVSFRFSLTQ